MPRLELLSSVIGEGMGEGEGGCHFVRHDGWMDVRAKQSQLLILIPVQANLVLRSKNYELVTNVAIRVMSDN